MGDDQARSGDLGRRLVQAAHDVVVRQAVEAVAANAGVAELARQGEGLRDVRLAAMERRVEAGDLRKMRRRGGDRLDRRKVVRLVQRRQRHQAGELGQNVGIDARRRGELHAAMDDAMAERQHRPSGQQLAPQRDDLVGGAAMVEAAGGPGPFRHAVARRRWSPADAARVPGCSTCPRNSNAPSCPAS